MTSTIPISVRLTPEKTLLLSQIAKSEERSRNYIINAAIDFYIEAQKEWDEGIKTAIKEAENGLTISAKKAFDEIRGEFWKIRLTHSAQKDLREIAKYLVNNFPSKSEATYKKIIETCEKIVDFLSVGKIGRVKNTRELKISNLPYYIIYQTNNKKLTILRIYHTSRNSTLTLH